MLKRDEWLTKAMEKIIDVVFKPHDLRMPPLLKIAAGLCPGKAIGICADPKYADDGAVHIWITPELGKDEVMEILGTIVHELCHATCCGQGYELSEVKHGAPFTKFIRTVGLEGKPKSTIVKEGTELYATLQGIAADLGPYDHAPLRKAEKKTRVSEILTYISESDADYSVKAKYSLVVEKGVPRDYNGQPMIPKDMEKFLELEDLFGGEVETDAEADSDKNEDEAAE